MVKPVYYSEAAKKYYFNENVFGNFKAITVYGMERITIAPGDVKKDKNGKSYVLIELKREFSEKNAKAYFKAVKVAEKKVKDEAGQCDTQESAF